MAEIMDQLIIVGETVLAAILGGLVGLEREIRKKPVGLRTHMLVAAAACILVGLGSSIVTLYVNAIGSESLEGDPIRIIQAIIVGISFIGGGLIIKDTRTDEVKNLTTAASILLATTIGICVALQLYVLAVGATLIGLVINVLILQAEKEFSPKREK